MSLQSFFDNFAQLAETPNGIPKLRDLILELAIKGKLVAQDLQDEPASLLLERTREVNNKRGNHGDRSETSIRSFSETGIPFALAPNWAWTTLARVGHDWGQKKPNIDFTYIDVAAIDNHRGAIKNSVMRLKPNEAPSRARKIVKRGSVLYSTVRPYLLNIAVVEKDYSPEPIASTAFAIIHPFEGISAAYLFYYLRSRTFIQIVENKMQGVAYPAINDESLFSSVIPLPPTREQERIVSKVYELMRLCDELEARQQEKRESRLRLNKAALAPLNKPASLTRKEFEKAIGRFTGNFDTLYDSTDTVGKLRSTILQLAVQGKLVRHNLIDKPVLRDFPSEDSSSRDYDCRAFSESSKSIAVPSHWLIQPLTRVASAVVDCPHSTPKWTTKGKICVRTNQFRPGCLDLSDNRFVSEETYLNRIQRLKPLEDDILYSREGGILGVACRVPPNTELCLGQRMMLIRSGAVADPGFLEMVLNSPFITEIAKARTTGGAAPRVNVATVKAYPIPLPPFAEQKRIVAKVNQLMALCNDLETKLRQAEVDGEKLMDAAVKYVLDVVSGKNESQRESALAFTSTEM